MSNLSQRMAVGVISLTIALFAIYVSFKPVLGLFFPALISTLGAFALWEFYQIAKVKGYEPLVKIGIFYSLLFMATFFMATQKPPSTSLPMVVLVLALAHTMAFYFRGGKLPLLNASVTIFGIAYLTLPLASLIGINYLFMPGQQQDGRLWFLYLMLITKFTDMGAYFFGKMYGRNKLAPYISPAKTWEGTLGGSLIAILASLLFYLIVHFTKAPMQLSLWQSLFLGTAIALVSQFGDLAESLLKRDGGVKDSNQLPGLGGILDMVDSIIFSGPLLYFFLKLHYGV